VSILVREADSHRRTEGRSASTPAQQMMQFRDCIMATVALEGVSRSVAAANDPTACCARRHRTLGAV